MSAAPEGTEEGHAELRVPQERDRRRVLAIAYACEPGRGSEPGAGWGLVHVASSFAHCTILTGPEHTAALERWRAGHPEAPLEVVEVPEPAWSRMAKRGRIGRFLVYLAWLRRAKGVAAELLAHDHFSVIWHVTFSTYWLPSPVVDFDLPSVWGPVGGAVTTPVRLWRFLGPGGVLVEIGDRVAVRLLARRPAARRTAREATVSLTQNEATSKQLPGEAAKSAAIFNHSLLIDAPPPRRAASGRDLVWVGALESRKGPRLAIKALAQTPDHVRLVMLGDGPERHQLERLVRNLGVEHRVEMRGRVPRSEVVRLLESCAAAVFTGLREEGGLALAEAMYTGVPVIVLAHGGAETIVRHSTDPDRVALVLPGDAADTVRLLAVAMARFARQPPAGSGPLLDRDAAVAKLEDHFASALVIGH